MQKAKWITEGFVFSNFSSADNGCLGVRNNQNGTVDIVDSKTDQILTFTPKEWRAFVKGAINGEFDKI